MHCSQGACSAQRQKILELSNTIKLYQKELEAARRRDTLGTSVGEEEYRRLQDTTERLRRQNDELREEIEEVNAMVELLKGRQGLVVSSPRSSPVLGPVAG